jgi:hypothetical protein
MGLLIRLKSPVLEGGTALKSLKYGKDRPGEGDSGQPYVQTPIDQPTSFSDEDTILRGGLKAPPSALKDVSRLTKYFFDNKNPDGLLFIAKQNILSRISTKTEASGLFFNEGIYTPLSTLTQTGVGFAGAHFNKQILGIKKYQDIVFENNKEENNGNDYDNRLLKLWNNSGLKLELKYDILALREAVAAFLNVPSSLNLNVTSSSISPVLYSYGGGPNSILGIGKTNINFATTNNGSTPLRTTDGNFYPKSTQGKTTTLPTDFRAQLLPTSTNATFLGAAYTSSNSIETLFNLGSPGQRGNLKDYKKGKEDITSPGKHYPLDKVNASYIYKSLVSDGYKKEEKYDDLIPFVIGILNNDKQTSGTYIKYMHFRAFIKKTSDSYKADWKGIEYMGRGEKFYRYKGFDRDMSISFTVVAQSVKEQMAMYDKLNFLASTLAPDYLDTDQGIAGYMAGNIAYITIGDYIVEQPGIITSLGLDIPEDSPWETGRDRSGKIYKNEPLSPKILPHMIEVNLKFIPIHKFRPQKLTFPNPGGITVKPDGLSDLGPQKYINSKRTTVSNNYENEGIELLNGNK